MREPPLTAPGHEPERAPTGPELLARDRGLLWHPYAPLTATTYFVHSARGVHLDLEARDGTRFDAVDAMSSWWSVVHGYRHPHLDAAMHAQTDRLAHVMFGGLTHEPAILLAERLIEMTRGLASPATGRELAHVFFADSGSVSMEVALKLAVQYQAATGHPGRRRFLALRGGYHGDTLGAMSVGDQTRGPHAAFAGLVPTHLFLPRPPAARLSPSGALQGDAEQIASWISVLADVVATRSQELAAVVVEPILQGAGGMHVWAPECLAAVRRVADEHGLLLLVDEIATGFGRTGPLFATEWAGVAPDIMCVGKALTGGYLTLGAVLCTSEVGAAITASDRRALLHGPTFMANPQACAVAYASLELIGDSWPGQVAAMQRELAAGLAPALDLPSVVDVRVLGGTGVIELNRAVAVSRLTRAALERGVWVRPFRQVVYTMPPYLCTSEDLAVITRGLVGAVEECG